MLLYFISSLVAISIHRLLCCTGNVNAYTLNEKMCTEEDCNSFYLSTNGATVDENEGQDYQTDVIDSYSEILKDPIVAIDRNDEASKMNLVSHPLEWEDSDFESQSNTVSSKSLESKRSNSILTNNENDQMIDDINLTNILENLDRYPLLNAIRGYPEIPDQNVDYNFPASSDEKLKEYLEFLKVSHASCYHKFDKFGRPVIIQRVGELDPDKKFNISSLIYGHIIENEYFIRRLFPVAQKRKEILNIPGNVNVNQIVMIVDFKGFSAKHFTNLRKLQPINDLDRKHYPDMLAAVYLINVPPLFRWGLNSCGKAFMDKKTWDITRIMGNRYLSELLKIINVNDLPVEYGGKCSCKGDCIPTPPFNLVGSKQMKNIYKSE